MNKLSTQIIHRLLLSALLFGFVACKSPATEEAKPQPVVKSVNKTTIAPKKWQTEGGSTIHDLKAGGTYGDLGGTWGWKNTKSDTMLIVTKTGFPEVQWKIHWNTDTDMEAENLTNHVLQKFKNKAW